MFLSGTIILKHKFTVAFWGGGEKKTEERSLQKIFSKERQKGAFQFLL